MSRVYEAALDAVIGGEWRWDPCEECAGDNQRQNPMGKLKQWWFGDRSDYVCCLCRADIEAMHQQRAFEERQTNEAAS